MLESAERLFRELSSGDPESWERLETLPSIAPLRQETAPEIVFAAIRRWLRFGPRIDRPSTKDRLEYFQLTFGHRLALAEARTRELGFARLVIEEAHRSLQNAEPGSRRTLEEVERILTELEPATPRRYDLQALAYAYQVEDFSLADRTFQATGLIGRARRLLHRGSGDPEIEAEVEAMEGILLISLARPSCALESFMRAESLLEDQPGLEEEFAETVRRRCNLQCRVGDRYEALAAIRRALGKYPEGGSPFRRLRLLHLQAELEIELGWPHAAVERLHAEAPAYREFPLVFLLAERSRLLGLGHLRLREDDRAEAELLQAMAQCRQAGAGHLAITVITDLIHLYVISGNTSGLAEMEHGLEDSCQRPLVRSDLLAGLRRVHEIIGDQGIVSPFLDEWVARFAQEERKETARSSR